MSKKVQEVTPEIMNELETWFASAELPAELQLDEAVYIPNLKNTVTRLLEQSRQCVDNPKMHGSIYLLIRIKNMLEGHPEQE